MEMWDLLLKQWLTAPSRVLAEELKHRLRWTPGSRAQSLARWSSDSRVMSAQFQLCNSQTSVTIRRSGNSMVSEVEAFLMSLLWHVWESFGKPRLVLTSLGLPMILQAPNLPYQISAYLKCFCLLPWTQADPTVFPIVCNSWVITGSNLANTSAHWHHWCCTVRN